MKITMYELLGLVKDGKAPKKIVCNNIELEYDEDTNDYYPYYDKYLFEFKFANCVDFLNDEVEIVEEDKKIEKLNDKLGLFGDGNTQKIINELNYTRTIINELIDEINNLKEKQEYE